MDEPTGNAFDTQNKNAVTGSLRAADPAGFEPAGGSLQIPELRYRREPILTVTLLLHQHDKSLQQTLGTLYLHSAGATLLRHEADEDLQWVVLRERL